MTRFALTAARRTIVSTVTALILASALPTAALATPSDGIWKVNPAKSSFSSGYTTLVIDRTRDAHRGAGAFIVVSDGNVYLVTSATAQDNRGAQQVNYARMASEGKAVLIGRNAKSTGICGFRCQGGLPELHMTLSFRAVNGAGQHINEMLAQQ
jgi:hypothetical protein